MERQTLDWRKSGLGHQQPFSANTTYENGIETRHLRIRNKRKDEDGSSTHVHLLVHTMLGVSLTPAHGWNRLESTLPSVPFSEGRIEVTTAVSWIPTLLKRSQQVTPAVSSTHN